MTKQTLILIAFGASLVANGFLGGVIATSHKGCDMKRDFKKGHHHMKALSVLEGEHKERVEKIMKEHKDASKAVMKEMHGLFKTLNAEMAAPELDFDKIDILQNEIDELDTGLKESMASMMLEIAKVLPSEERVEFFKKMGDKSPFMKHRSHHKEKHGDRDKPREPRDH